MLKLYFCFYQWAINSIFILTKYTSNIFHWVLEYNSYNLYLYSLFFKLYICVIDLKFLNCLKIKFIRRATLSNLLNAKLDLCFAS